MYQYYESDHPARNNPDFNEAVVQFLINRPTAYVETHSPYFFTNGLLNVRKWLQDNFPENQWEPLHITFNPALRTKELKGLNFTDLTLTSLVPANTSISTSLFRRVVFEGINSSLYAFPGKVVSSVFSECTFDNVYTQQVTFDTNFLDSIIFNHSRLQPRIIKTQVKNSLFTNSTLSFNFPWSIFQTEFYNITINSSIINHFQVNAKSDTPLTLRNSRIYNSNLNNLFCDYPFGNFVIEHTAVYGTKLNHVDCVYSLFMNDNTFTNVSFYGVDLTGLLAKKNRLEACVFNDMHISYASMEDTFIHQGVLHRINADKANISNMTIVESDIANTSLQRTHLNGLKVNNSSMRDSTLKNALIQKDGLSFNSTQLTRVNLNQLQFQNLVPYCTESAANCGGISSNLQTTFSNSSLCFPTYTNANRLLNVSEIPGGKELLALDYPPQTNCPATPSPSSFPPLLIGLASVAGGLAFIALGGYLAYRGYQYFHSKERQENLLFQKAQANEKHLIKRIALEFSSKIAGKREYLPRPIVFYILSKYLMDYEEQLLLVKHYDKTNYMQHLSDAYPEFEKKCRSWQKKSQPTSERFFNFFSSKKTVSVPKKPHNEIKKITLDLSEKEDIPLKGPNNYVTQEIIHFTENNFVIKDLNTNEISLDTPCSPQPGDGKKEADSLLDQKNNRQNSSCLCF